MGKGASKRAIAKLLNVAPATIARDVGEGRQARQRPGSNRPVRVLQAAKGALQTLARIEALTYYTDEQLAEYFASLNVKADKLRFLGATLEGIGEMMKKEEAQAQERKCVECGSSLAGLDGEARAHYCSPKCRQTAYRKRVTAKVSHRTRKPSQRRLRDVETVAENGLAVTHEQQGQ
jgi:IS30 family transposase